MEEYIAHFVRNRDALQICLLVVSKPFNNATQIGFRPLPFKPIQITVVGGSYCHCREVN